VLVQANDVIQELAGPAQDAILLIFEAYGEVALLYRLEDFLDVLDLGAAVGREPVPFCNGDCSTNCVHHHGWAPVDHHAALTIPIFLTASFALGVGYSLHGSRARRPSPSPSRP